jgi:hypothetical protein
VTVPDTVSQALSSVNASLPTLDQLRAQINNLIGVPFNALRMDINSSLTGTSIDRSLFPVPAQDSVSFCGDLDLNSVDDVANVILNFLKIALGLTALAMVILVLAMGWWERRRQRKLVEHVERVRGVWLQDETPYLGTALAPSVESLLAFLSVSQHPSLYALLLRLKLSPGLRADLEWICSLIFHPRPFTILIIGVTTLLAVEAQFLALGIVRRQASDQAVQSLGALDDNIRNQINSALLTKGTEWANGTNSVILGFQDGVNNDMVRSLESLSCVVVAADVVFFLVQLGQRHDGNAELYAEHILRWYYCRWLPLDLYPSGVY